MSQVMREGFRTVTPYIVVKGARAAVDFYKKAFAAEELSFSTTPDGVCMHADIKIGDSIVMLNDEFPKMNVLSPLSRGGTSVTLHVYVADVDAAFARAVAAGATAKMPPADMFWGDRYAQITDPFGHSWSLATPKESPTPEQMQERMKKAFGGTDGCGEGAH
jgi:PhnB protein